MLRDKFKRLPNWFVHLVVEVAGATALTLLNPFLPFHGPLINTYANWWIGPVSFVAFFVCLFGLAKVIDLLAQKHHRARA
jgi:hypothetical protein